MRYFSVSEMLKSDTAIAKKIWNGATIEQEENLRALVENVLDPLRLLYGKPITVNSGFRNALVNKAVGGVGNSQHLRGEAADITTGTRLGNQHLARLLAQSTIPYDQLIDEANYQWVHVSYKKNGQNRKQILRMRNNKYTIIKKEEL